MNTFQKYRKETMESVTLLLRHLKTVTNMLAVSEDAVDIEARIITSVILYNKSPVLYNDVRKATIFHVSKLGIETALQHGVDIGLLKRVDYSALTKVHEAYQVVLKSDV